MSFNIDRRVPIIRCFGKDGTTDYDVWSLINAFNRSEGDSKPITRALPRNVKSNNDKQSTTSDFIRTWLKYEVDNDIKTHYLVVSNNNDKQVQVDIKVVNGSLSGGVMVLANLIKTARDLAEDNFKNNLPFLTILVKKEGYVLEYSEDGFSLTIPNGDKVVFVIKETQLKLTNKINELFINQIRYLNSIKGDLK